MSSKDAHLYGQRPASRTKTKNITGSSSVAFSSTLSSLIQSASSTPDTTKPTAGRARPKKEDIFTSHNKNVKKRALKDLEDNDFTQKHRGRTAAERAEDDAVDWQRSKRRMEEKARLYHALKRGDIEDLDDKYGVDFDRKWAEAQKNPSKHDELSSSSDSESEAEELIEYTDEFGRSRKGTRAEIAREERRKRTIAADEPDRFTARPSMPTQIIYGDTVQTNAFNPEETIAQQMADLAAKRDRSLTPPPDLHFDGREEARQRGTGFFYFSKDKEEREEQMARLERERKNTERAQEERKRKLEERRELVEKKREAIRKKHNEKRTERFLDELGEELFQKQTAAVAPTTTEAKEGSTSNE